MARGTAAADGVYLSWEVKGISAKRRVTLEEGGSRSAEMRSQRLWVRETQRRGDAEIENMRILKCKKQKEIPTASAVTLTRMRSFAYVAGFPRSGERSDSLADAAGYQDEVSSEKQMCAVRKNAAPLEPLAKNTGNFDVFQEDQLELVEPLANCPGFFDVLGRVDTSKVCAPWKKQTIAGNYGLTRGYLKQEEIEAREWFREPTVSKAKNQNAESLARP